jgi:histidinol phosphatase-like PHP family hydrolase
MYDSIVNALCLFALLYIIYQSYIEYKKSLEFKQLYITDHNELHEKLNECKNSQLYNIYQHLSEEDKKFLEVYINYARIKQKNSKPRYTKIYNGIKNQIILSTVLAIIMRKNPGNIMTLLRKNTLQQFCVQFL